MAILNHTSTSVETESLKPREQPAKPPMQASAPGSGGGWNRRDTLALLLILLVAGGLRVLRLAEPNAVVFDETYYAKDACLYLGHSQQFCGLDQATEQSYVHPPLGKWLISLGISAFGYNSFGWRFSAAVFGTAVAGLAFVVARKLFADRWTAVAAGLLTATDLLLLVQSRIAMLDIFLTFFVLLGFLFLVYDRQRVLRVRDHHGAPPPRPAGAGTSGDRHAPSRGVLWRFAAGAAFGLALSVKWSALLALGAAAVCALFWSLELLILGRKQRSASYGPPRPASLARELAISFTAFFLIPLVVYAGAYGGYFVDRLRQDCPYTVPSDPDRLFDSRLLGQPEGRCMTGIKGTAISFGDLQDRILDYHANLDAEHSYQSKAWTWPLVLRPVAYFYESKEGKAIEVMALGNIAGWYAALLALFWLIPKSRQRWRPERLVLLAWGAQYLPWLLVPRPLFLFYMTPVVPFMMIALAATLGSLLRGGRRRSILGGIYLAVACGVFLVLFYPVVAAVPLPQRWWEWLMWIPQFDCGGFKCGWI